MSVQPGEGETGSELCLQIPESTFQWGRNLAAPGGASLSFLVWFWWQIRLCTWKNPWFWQLKPLNKPTAQIRGGSNCSLSQLQLDGVYFQQFIPFPVAFVPFSPRPVPRWENTGFSKHGLQGWDKPSKQQNKAV